MATAMMAAATTSCSRRRAAPLLRPMASSSSSPSSSSSSSSARPRWPLAQQLPRLLATATAAVAVAAAPLPALAEQMEKAALFDFNLTLPAIATEFLLLMVALDKLYFTPLGKFMDERDAKIRGELGDVKDASEEVKQLEEQAAAIMKAARAEIAAALNKMKKETTAELEAKLDEGRSRVEAELVEALANLEAQKEEAVKALDAQIASLSDEIVKKSEQSFPLDRGLAPPWWPTGEEAWWGSQGEVQAHQGVPPYRKPHDLKKAWKISLLSAVIKHMSPRFDQMRKLVWQSKRLQQKMSARETETWSKILRQKETLSRRLKSLLKITPLDADGDGDGDDEEEDGLEDVVRGVHDKRKRELISTGGNIGQSSSSRGGGELVAGLVADENDLICPIDELLKRYYSCVPDQHDSVVAPENEAGVMTMPLGELDLCGVVDDVPPDVLFDLIASCSGADDAFRLMED